MEFALLVAAKWKMAERNEMGQASALTKSCGTGRTQMAPDPSRATMARGQQLKTLSK